MQRGTHLRFDNARMALLTEHPMGVVAGRVTLSNDEATWIP